MSLNNNVHMSKNLKNDLIRYCTSVQVLRTQETTLMLSSEAQTPEYHSLSQNPTTAATPSTITSLLDPINEISVTNTGNLLSMVK